MEWIDDLPKEVRNSLDTLLDDVENHTHVYEQAQNASVGQIWVAMALMNRRIGRLEELVQAQRKALQESDTDVDKHLDERLKESLKRY